MQENWIRLHNECRLPEEVGRKAYHLWQLVDMGLPVPNWIALTTSAFDTFIARNPKLVELRDDLRTRTVSKINLIGAAEVMQQAILDTPLPDEVVSVIKAGVERAGLRYPLAVRSSAQFEDLPNASQAGAYVSFLNIHEDTLIDAIKKCWASLYGRRAVLGIAEATTDLTNAGSDLSVYGMAVIIQEMIEGDKFGVLFTADPLSGNTGVLHIESSPSAAGVVSGEVEPERVVVLRDTRQLLQHDISETSGRQLTQDEIGVLIEIGLTAEERFGAPQDIEWVTHSGKVWLLQARPIGQRQQKKPPLNEIRLYSTETENIDDLMEFGDCEGLRRAYERKKFPLRRHAHRNGIRLPAWYWLEYDAATLSRTPTEVIEAPFEAEYVWIDLSTNLRGMSIKRSDIKPFLLSMVESHPAGRMTALVRDSFATEVGAISSMLPNDLVIIEYVYGTLKGIISGIAETSKVWVAPDDTVVDRQVNTQHNAVVLDQETLLVVERYIGEVQVELPEAVIPEMNRGTRSLATEFPQGRPEWWIVNNKAYLFDISLESSPLHASSSAILTLAPGTIEGRAFVIDDLTPFAGLFDGWAVNVESMDNRILELPAFQNFLPRLEEAAKQGPVILVAPRPHVALAAFLNYFSGCVFAHGALLSHLAIVLRERRIPGIVYRDALANIRDGDTIRISEDDVAIVAQAESIEP